MTTTIAAKRIPVVLSGQALRSLRDSGFSLPAALGEPIDNSIEADANNIEVLLQEAKDQAGKKHIHRIVIVDDGHGMDRQTLQHYLQLGFSTRYMSKSTIGKYGVGAKLAALNFGRRIDVWSRTNAPETWQHVVFDLDDALEQEKAGEMVMINEPDQAVVPSDLAEVLPSGTGTVVVWSKVDRLEEGRRAKDANTLRVEVEKELSRIFRHFLHGGIKISVNDNELLPHDPLFLMEGTWADKALTEHLASGDDEDRKASRSQPGEMHFDHFGAELLYEEPIKVGGSEATLRVTLHPKEVTRHRGSGGDRLAKLLRVPENEGSISFVRLNREINYTNVPRLFPRGVEEPDRFIGIEVSFKPELDEFFGVRNVKRGVEPHDELRVELRKILKKPIDNARAKLEERWGAVARQSRTHEGEHGPVVDAAKEVNRTLPKARAKGIENPAEEKRLLDDLARDVGHTEDVDKKAYLNRIKELPFVVESVDFPGTNFIDIQHLSGKVIIRLNTRHRFYREMWEPLKDVADRAAGTVSGEEAVRVARRTIEALTLLLIAYGKAESMEENPHEQYGDLRSYWGQFLDTLLGKVKNVR